MPALVADKKALSTVAKNLGGADLDAGYALEDMTLVNSGKTLASLSHVAQMADSAARMCRHVR